MRELVAILVAFGLCLGGLLLTGRGPGPASGPPPPQAAHAGHQVAAGVPRALKFPSPGPIIESSDSPPEPLAAQPLRPFRLGAVAATALPPAAPDLTTTREIAFDAAALSTASPGDEIALDLPQLGGRYALRVETVTEEDDGTHRLSGAVAWDGRRYPGLISIGTQWSFGTLSTPEGSYEFTARNGQARIVDLAEIDRRTRPGQTDYLVPPDA
ncbi:MAG: hypothetical protein V2I63_01355 [Pseudomonadales bacterium]|jgi:hypothetical protein|nr:hypothetical protein [Pseudomonadales bacterium]